MSDLEHPFTPILFRDTQILILGTFPSIKSFENSFYYAHPRNQFWKILSDITGYPVTIKEQKIWLLKQMKWGLWDMVKSCNRDNSLDTSLKSIEVNDISSLLNEYPSIQKIAFTGKKAQQLYHKSFPNLDIETIYLPSPSPAFASMKYEDKRDEYKRLLIDSMNGLI